MDNVKPFKRERHGIGFVELIGVVALIVYVNAYNLKTCVVVSLRSATGSAKQIK